MVMVPYLNNSLKLYHVFTDYKSDINLYTYGKNLIYSACL